MNTENGNLALSIIDEAIEFEGFVIDNDVKAEWALKKISEEKAEAQRYINICDTMISEYTFKKQQATEKLESKISGLRSLLQQYFETVPHKATKTQETYKLPSGQLKMKYPGPEFARDEEKLLNYLKENGMPEYIQTKESAKWADLKKVVTVSGDKVITEDGQIVDGVTVVERPPVFEVEV